MTSGRPEAFDPTFLVHAWVRAAADFFRQAAAMKPSQPEGAPESDPAGPHPPGRVQDHWQTMAAACQSLFRLAGNPDTAKGLMDAAGTSPLIGLKMANAWWKGFFTLQQWYMEKAAGLAAKTEAYKFEDIDKEAFKAWTDLYEREIQGIFNMPPMGLARVYQEKANRMMDRFNLFQAAVSRFIYLTYLPLEKSLRVVQQELAALSENEKPAVDFKETYRKWIRVLEGHYMTLLKSPEYTEALTVAIRTYAEFTAARHGCLEDYVKGLPVPTQKELDDVYRELYELKKELKEIRKSAGKTGRNSLTRG